MRKSHSSILLIFLMGIILFPWQLVKFCPAHKGAHQEHHGNCADGMMDDENHGKKASEGSLTLKAVDECSVFSLVTEDFQPNTNQLKINFQQLIFITAYLHLQSIEATERRFPKPPDQRSNSDPPLESIFLRGPPLV